MSIYQALSKQPISWSHYYPHFTDEKTKIKAEKHVQCHITGSVSINFVKHSVLGNK